MTVLHWTCRSALALFTVAATFAAPPHTAEAQDRTYAVAPVAVAGEPAPGTNGLSFACFPDYFFARLNESGVVAFRSSTELSQYCVSNEGVWVGTPGNVSLAARAGDPAPGTTGRLFDDLSVMQLNALGEMAIGGRTADAATGYYAEYAVWTGFPGNLELVVVEGDPAPGTGGLPFSVMSPMSLSDLGTLTLHGYFGSIYNNLGYGRGLWAGVPGSLEPVVLTGDFAPGTNGLSFTDLISSKVNGDHWAIRGETDDPDPARAEGIWTIGPNGMNLVVRAGDEVPGTGGRLLRTFWSGNQAPPLIPELLNPGSADGLILNERGEVAFSVYLDPIDPLNTYDDEGLLVHDASGLRLAALTGDPAPGTQSVTFRNFNHHNLNASGVLAFDASLNTADMTRDHGIWVGPPDNLSLLVREGDPAPGTFGETFAHMRFGPSLNDRGDVAFLGKLRESGGSGIWIAAPDGSMALVARTGDFMQVASGDYRQVKSFPRQEGGGFGGPDFINTAGQFVFLVDFADGTSGIILASPAPAGTNQPPVADAGPDRLVAENDTIMIDGSASYDPEGTVLSFVWSRGGVAISTEPKLTMGPLAVGTDTLTLTVTDRSGASSTDSMTLTVVPNDPPVASAGPDQTIHYSQSATLDGTGSYDPDGQPLTYRWSYNGTLLATGASSTVQFDTAGIYYITLTVEDPFGVVAWDTMLLTVTNEAPVANAGPDQTVQTLETVTLDGLGSTDPEGEALSFSWSRNGIEIATGPNPIIGPFEAGTHTIRLIVADGRGGYAADTMQLTVLNRAPTANAGPDVTVPYTQPVALDGTGSSDPEEFPLSYAWRHSDGTLISTDPKPFLGRSLVAITFDITLTVTDDQGATDTDVVTVNVINDPPIADAGADQTVNHAQLVTFDGSRSIDPEGGSYMWYIWTIGGIDHAFVNPTYTAGPFPVGTYPVTLTVQDELGLRAMDSMTLIVINEVPVANAGQDQTVGVKGKTTTVTLDGSASSDPEGGALSYLWTLDGQNVGAGAVAQVDVPPGTHDFTLTVTDDHGATAADTVVVTAVRGNV